MDRLDLSDLHVVVVDDSPHVCSLIRIMLSAFGIRRVRTFQDCAAALEDIQCNPPDMLLCDWEMRPMDGLTLVSTVRQMADRRLATMPIVMVTAHTSEERVRAAQAAGVTHVVVKPLTAQILYDRVAWAAARPSGTRAELDAAPGQPLDDGLGAGRLAAPMR